jgi:hypothetical protein
MLLAPFGSKVLFYLNIRTGFGAQRASYSTGRGGFFFWVTWPGHRAEYLPYYNAPLCRHGIWYCTKVTYLYLLTALNVWRFLVVVTYTLYYCRQNKDKGQVPGGLQRPSAAGIGKGVPLQSVHHNQKEGRAGNKFGALWEAGESVNSR